MAEDATELRDWERSTIELFVGAAGLIGLPRSVGEIYGLLYCAENPLTFDEVESRLGISRGSASNGLKLLRQLGAVKVHYVPGSRRDHYVPELSMRRLAQGFIRDQINPHLESGGERLDDIERLVAEESDDEVRAHAEKRIATLRSWRSRTRRLLPFLVSALGGRRARENDPPSDEHVV